MNGGGQRVQRIALFGKGHALWPVAALLVQNLPPDIELIAVEEPEDADPVAITIRLDDPLLLQLGIGAQDLHAASSAIFSLGTELRDLCGDGSRYFLTGSGDLPDVENIAIHQIMLRAALIYDQPDRLAYLYRPFRLPARAAEAGKFALQSSDPRSPLSMLRPTVQMDRTDYAALLKKGIPSKRMERVEARPKAAHTASAAGIIEGIELDNALMVKADLYIDVSGALSGLAGADSQSDWNSMSGGIPFDRRLTVEGLETRLQRERHAVATAMEGGLLISTPLRETSVTELLYASNALADDAEQTWIGNGAKADSFAPGYISRPWAGNLLRLGRASSCFGPFLSADMTILQHQAVLLSRHLPVHLDMTVEAREFNRRHLIVAEQIRDFVQLPFALNRRDDAPWASARESNLPDSLAIRLQQFRSRGRFVAFEGEIFDAQSWIDLMIGFGLVPERYDPMAQSLDMTNMARRLKKLTMAFDHALAAIPE